MKVSKIAAEMADREALRDLLYRYCRGIDRCDEEMLRGTYWPDGTDDHIAYVGPAPEFIDFALKGLKELMDVTQHLVGNMYIEIDGDRAHTETYFTVLHRYKDKAVLGRPAYDMRCGGRYIDVMEKRDDEWRIFNRVTVLDWFREFDDTVDWSKGFEGAMTQHGLRKPDDRSYKIF